jgi:hypothetical protein
MSRSSRLAALALIAALPNIGATCAQKAPTCAEQLALCAPSVAECLRDCANTAGCLIDACKTNPTPTP